MPAGTGKRAYEYQGNIKPDPRERALSGLKTRVVGSLPTWRPKASALSHRWMAWDYKRGEPYLEPHGNAMQGIQEGTIRFFSDQRACLIFCDTLNKASYVNPTKEKA